jgi:hypothetical protein
VAPSQEEESRAKKRDIQRRWRQNAKTKAQNEREGAQATIDRQARTFYLGANAAIIGPATDLDGYDWVPTLPQSKPAVHTVRYAVVAF